MSAFDDDNDAQRRSGNYEGTESLCACACSIIMLAQLLSLFCYDIKYQCVCIELLAGDRMASSSKIRLLVSIVFHQEQKHELPS